MERLNLKPTHKAVLKYYEALRQFKNLGVSHEGAVRSAFQDLLESCGSKFGWKLVPEWPIKRDRAHSLRIDGALVDEYRLTHGFWEAKDSHDDLGKEVKKKLTAGYPQNNIMFQAPERAILWQNGRSVLDLDITEPVALVEIVRRFFDYSVPEYEDWNDAVAHFQNQVPELGRALAELIKDEEKSNPRFREAFEDFLALCRQSINPNLSAQAVEEMLIQHLLTERIFRTVFNNPDFTRRNVIAVEIEKVIDALTSQSFSREGFLQSLERFYKAIDSTAKTIEDFSQKQLFLNTVYEKFFQGFSVNIADTHGIVYTPQPIVNFMVRSVEDILQKEFGKSLSSPNVHILDPFVGTGNFIVHIMQAVKKTALAKKFHNELHCNEVMLLPYYIASMNIEHEFYEMIGTYESFEGVCLVDTFDIVDEGQAKGTQMPLVERFNAENTARVEKQKGSPIKVIIGNPPYNAKQVNENDNNKNRKYKFVDGRVSDTYAKDSKASLVNKLNDPYVKAIRWSSDRIGDEGIVAFVTNSSFVHKNQFDGMRMHLNKDFNRIYILDLKGDVRSDSMRGGVPLGERHTIFGLAAMVGIAITFFIRGREFDDHKVFYSEVDWRSTRKEKFDHIEEAGAVYGLSWTELFSDSKNTWITEGLRDEFSTFTLLGSRETKSVGSTNVKAIFKSYSLGVSTNRDSIVYDFNRDELLGRVDLFIDRYNSEVNRYIQKGKPEKLDDFLDNEHLQWSESLKRKLKSGEYATFDATKAVEVIYRPFTKRYLYRDPILNDRPGLFSRYLPDRRSQAENQAIAITNHTQIPFLCQMISHVPSLDVGGRPSQGFPFYTYNKDGSNRRENLTDWSLQEFRTQYADDSITKWDIFHFVYAVLHHPLFRERYAADLNRELPRIPFAPDFRAYADIGKRLAEIHVNYEQQPEYPLDRIETPGAPLDWRVEKMKLSKDKRSVIYNDFLTLSGIPPEVFEYRLGNRSALDWIIDQYRVSTDKRSGITNDPNRLDDPQYIVRLIGQVITVSVETVQLVRRLNEFSIVETASS